jgi:phenylacetate-CoA ligase
VDTALDLLFNTARKKTFLINCTPMGVHIETSLPLAETSVRSDMAIAMLKKVSGYYDQTIIIGDPFFLKKLVEESCEAGILWKKLGVSLVMGQDWFPETLRTYLAGLMEMDPEATTDRKILATMGLTELGLNIFHETPETVKIRRMAQRDAELRHQLFGTQKTACGYLFHYYPMRFFVEEHNDGSLLFTTLSKSAVIPLIRYDSGDCGKLVSYNDLVQLLSRFRLEYLNPRLKLPLATMTGRVTNFQQWGNYKIYPEDLKLGLYEVEDAARQTTGYFILSSQQEIPVIDIQLKPGLAPSAGLSNLFSDAFQRYVKPELAIKLHRYNDFPYGMELNYEKKFLNFK